MLTQIIIPFYIFLHAHASGWSNQKGKTSHLIQKVLKYVGIIKLIICQSSEKKKGCLPIQNNQMWQSKHIFVYKMKMVRIFVLFYVGKYVRVAAKWVFFIYILIHTLQLCQLVDKYRMQSLKGTESDIGKWCQSF